MIKPIGILFQFLLIISYNNVSAQDIPIIPLENVEWEYFYTDPGGVEKYHQYTVGDSIINGLQYTVFNWDRYFVDFDWVDISSKSTMKFYIRIDSGKVFRCYNEFDEKLIFNSNWKVNDSIYDGWENTLYIVTNIDTIDFYGDRRRRWEFVCPSESIFPDYFIEGVGGLSNDLREPIFKFHWEAGGTLVCFKQDNQIIVNDHCFFCTGLNQFDTNPYLKIYPNPASKMIHIENMQLNEESQITLYNMNGKVVHMIDFQEISNNRILLPNIISGIYVLRIVKNERTYEKKIVVQND